MPETFIHGVTITEIDTGSRPIRVAATSIIGVVGTGGGTVTDFPLDTPVLVNKASQLASVTGYLKDAIDAIFAQCQAVCVVVRTDDTGEDAAAKATDWAGTASDGTGVYALKAAQSKLGIKPRIIVGEYAAHANGLAAVKAVANSLRAVAILDAAGAAASDATTWTTTNGNERTFSVWPTVNTSKSLATFVSGAIARSDSERGYWWSPSNFEIFGITSMDKAVDFELGDATSTANVLNEGKVATLIRQGGFKLWGNLSGSTDSKWAFLSTRRIADVINDSLLAAHLWAVDRGITKTYLEDVAEGVNAFLRDQKAAGAILGGRCWPNPDLNSAANIALGNVYFDFDFTDPKPAQTVTFRSLLTNDYLTEVTGE